MISNMKKVFQLMKYGHQVKMNVLFGLGFLLLGVFMKVTEMTSMGIELLFPLMLPIFLCQIIYGLDYVKMISSADIQRWITVYVPDMIVDVSVLVMLALYYVLTKLRPYYPDGIVLNQDIYKDSISIPIGNIMFCAGLLAFILMCYVSGCYKCYWISTLLFVVAMGGYGAVSTWMLNPWMIDSLLCLTEGQGILAAFLFYVGGVAVGGGIRRLLYKIPVSSMAIGKRLGMAGKA